MADWTFGLVAILAAASDEAAVVQGVVDTAVGDVPASVAG